MSDLLTGRVRGKTIELDTSLPPLEGQRVLVRIERAEKEATETAEVSADQHARYWREWVERGPQRPIEDDGCVGLAAEAVCRALGTEP